MSGARRRWVLQRHETTPGMPRGKHRGNPHPVMHPFMEGQHVLVNKLSTIVPLSTEQMLECDELDTACHGGWHSGACKSVTEASGLASQEDYPYRWKGQTILPGKSNIQ